MKALFLDRDGVINEEVGFAYRVDQIVFRPGLFPFMRAAQDAGYKIIIVTNQAGIAYGHFEIKDFTILMDYMRGVFAQEGVSIQRLMACFESERPIAKPPYDRESFWRKPGPGMLLEAARKEKLDLAQSIMIGDRITDMQAALRAGVSKPLWLLDEHSETLQGVTNISRYDEAYAFL